MKNAIHPRIRILAAIVLLIFGTIVPAVGYMRVQYRVQQKTNAKLNDITNEHVYELTHRLEAYRDVLYSTRGLFAAAEVNDSVWDRFISNQSLSKRYPGMQAAAYARVVTQQEADAFERQMQNQMGASNFVIHPRKNSGDYVLITFHKETSSILTGRQSMGLDIASDAIRQEALMRSQKTGDIIATAPIKLATLHKTGFFLVTPVNNINGQQSDKPQGYVAAVFDVENLVNASMADRLNRYKTSMSIADVTDGKNNVFYKLAYPATGKTLQSSTTVDVGGRQWRITFNAPASDLLALLDRVAPIFMIVSTTMFVALIGTATYALRMRRKLRQGQS